MRPVRKGRLARGLPAAMGVCVALGLLLGVAGTGEGSRKPPTTPPAGPTWTITRDAPEVLDTEANLQQAFSGEMNARERYLASARQAEDEGYPAIGRIFRALAVAESIHARRTVQAIAVHRVPARALLDRIEVGTTAENLSRAIADETFEAEVVYPAYIERARRDRQPMAVRSLTLALATEREHVRILEQGLAHLGERPAAAVIHVCPYCGRTTDTLDFRKCPGCYTPASRFLRPA